MNARLLVTGLFLSCSLSAAAQLSGTFYLDKTTFAPGEPIFLQFKVTNHGDRDAPLATMGLPEQPVCAGYQIDISRKTPATSSCQKISPFNWCAYDGPLSAQPIEPGKSFTQRILLNVEPALKVAGDYSVNVRYYNPFDGPESKLNVATTLNLRVDSDAPAPTRALFQRWVNQLHSRDDRKRVEAAQVLANLGPPYLEEVLMSFGRNPDLRSFAPLAYRRLNTPRSRAALAALLKGRTTNEQTEAALYLAETGDQRWLPLLLDVAKEYAAIIQFPTAAAELGGDKAVPTLVSIEKSHDRVYAALNAVTALGYTDSRAAIPYLLEYLNSPESDLAERANGSLQILTHRIAKAGHDTHPANYSKWSQWWKRGGSTAPIYKASQTPCDSSQLQPLE